MRETSSPGEDVSDSQVGLCCMKSVS